MGFYNCKLHGETGIGIVCKHIARDIEAKRYEYPCHEIIFRIKNDIIGYETIPLTVCEYCFKSKNLKYENEIANYDIVINEMTKYLSLTDACSVCINEFIEKSTTQNKDTNK